MASSLFNNIIKVCLKLFYFGLRTDSLFDEGFNGLIEKFIFGD